MSHAWEKAQSFERTQQLLRAVNTVSLHTKRTLAGKGDEANAPRVKEARELLERFLTALAADLENLTHNQAVLSASPAPAGLFARRFQRARLECRDPSPLFARPLPEFIGLFDSTQPGKRQELVQGLAALRKVLEEHHYTDSVSLLGEL